MDKCIRILTGHKSNCVRALVSYQDINGEYYIYSGGNDGQILKYHKDICIKILVKSNNNPVRRLIIHNGHLISGHYSGEIRTWKDDKCTHVLRGHITVINDMVIHNDYLYSSDTNGRILKWIDEKYIELNIENIHPVVQSFASYDGYLYTGDAVRIIKWKNDKCIKIIYVNSVSWCITIHDNYIYTGHADKLLRKWNKNNDPLETFYQHPCYILSILSHNGCLYSCGHNSAFYKWNKDKCVQNIKIYKTTPYCMISQNDSIYVGCYDGTIIKYGEYWPNRHNALPQFQKEKIKIWINTNLGIHKDIKFLFERELLLDM